MFFSSVAHELRTPLNTIIPMSQQLSTNLTDNYSQTCIKIILNSSHHLQNIIEDALDMTRIENHRFQVNEDFFDIRQLINEVKLIMEF
jgi:signal transduction histidine kinase